MRGQGEADTGGRKKEERWVENEGVQFWVVVLEEEME